VTNLARGTIVDSRFEVVDVLGQGGMGVVYRARQKDIERDVALKMLKGDLALQPDKMKRFRREAQMISRLDHPNIVRVYAIGFEQGQPYIAMEYLSGRQLSDIVDTDGPMNWRASIPVLMQICDALQYAHEQNIIHRDIKPSNIVVTPEGAVKLVDFGIAKPILAEGQQLTQTEMVVGSVFYLSPGQFEGRAADVRSDMYSFGCTAFELLSGEPPFAGDTIFDTIQKKNEAELPKVNSVNPKAEIPEDLQKLLLWTTQKDADNRPVSMAVVKQKLQDILDGKALNITNQLSTPAPLAVHKSGKRNFRLLLIGLGLVAGCTLVYCWPRDKQAVYTEDRSVASNYLNSAANWINRRRPAKARIDTEKALAAAPASQKLLIGEIEYAHGVADLWTGKERAALRHFAKCTVEYRKAKYPVKQQTMVMLCFMRLGEFRKAANTYEDLKENANPDAPLETVAQECAAANHVGKYGVALELSKDYITASQAAKSAEHIALSNIELLTTKRGLGEPISEDERTTAESLAFNSAPGNVRGTALILLSEFYVRDGDPKKASELLSVGLKNVLEGTGSDDVETLEDKTYNRAHYKFVASELPQPYGLPAESAVGPLDQQIEDLKHKVNELGP
jgi:serine/threonine protein kinase